MRAATGPDRRLMALQVTKRAPRFEPFQYADFLDDFAQFLIRSRSYIVWGMKMPDAPSTANVVSGGPTLNAPALNKIEWVVRTLGVTIGEHQAPKTAAAAGTST